MFLYNKLTFKVTGASNSKLYKKNISPKLKKMNSEDEDLKQWIENLRLCRDEKSILYILIFANNDWEDKIREQKKFEIQKKKWKYKNREGHVFASQS